MTIMANDGTRQSDEEYVTVTAPRLWYSYLSYYSYMFLANIDYFLLSGHVKRKTYRLYLNIQKKI